jgi:hypothetical protein
MSRQMVIYIRLGQESSEALGLLFPETVITFLDYEYIHQPGEQSPP